MKRSYRTHAASMLAPNSNEKENWRPKQNTIAVSAIQARLIRAQTEDDVKKQVDKRAWEECKERVRVERSRLGKAQKIAGGYDAVKPTTSTSIRVPIQSTVRTRSTSRITKDGTPPARKKVRLPVTPKSASKISPYKGGVRTKVGQVLEIELNPNATKLKNSSNEAWERCKEQVRAEKAKQSQKIN